MRHFENNLLSIPSVARVFLILASTDVLLKSHLLFQKLRHEDFYLPKEIGTSLVPTSLDDFNQRPS
jgi:hypothetical protein